VITPEKTWSPKQLARRALVVDAAIEILKHEGITGCTVRAIAAATPFTKGTLHYYFNDVHEIVNAAYLRLTDQYVSAVDAVADAARTPTTAFWLALHAYVEGFRAHQGMGLLWFEYSSWAARNGYQDGVASSVEAIRAMFGRRLERVGATTGDPARALTRYMLGMVLELGASGGTSGEMARDVATICGLPLPRATVQTRPHATLCPLCRQS
jgi:AcrR family transcriptional regulator